MASLSSAGKLSVKTTEAILWLCLQHCTGINNWLMQSSLHPLSCHQLLLCHVSGFGARPATISLVLSCLFWPVAASHCSDHKVNAQYSQLCLVMPSPGFLLVCICTDTAISYIQVTWLFQLTRQTLCAAMYKEVASKRGC